MYKLVPTKEFAKGLKRLSQSEKKQVKNRLELLKDNPGHPSLRTKRLAGTNILNPVQVWVLGFCGITAGKLSR